MITEDYIDFNLAKELKKFEIGREVIWSHYYTETGKLKTCSLDFKIPEDYYCSCPSLSIIQKWLREKKSIFIEINNNWKQDTKSLSWLHHGYNLNVVYIKKKKSCKEISGMPFYDSYEEALLDGINKAIKILDSIKYS